MQDVYITALSRRYKSVRENRILSSALINMLLLSSRGFVACTIIVRIDMGAE
jgi:hypothetical protein